MFHFGEFFDTFFNTLTLFSVLGIIGWFISLLFGNFVNPIDGAIVIVVMAFCWSIIEHWA